MRPINSTSYNPDDKSFTLHNLQIPVTDEADVVVIGGGPAGFGASVRAAQNGVDTLIIEEFGSPGGTMSNGFMCATKVVEYGLQKEWNDELRLEGFLFDNEKKYPEFLKNPIIRSGETCRLNFYPDEGAYAFMKIIKRNKIRYLFRTRFINAIVKDGTILAIIIENASGLQAIKGKVFIDATGRGNVVERIGAPFIPAGGPDGRPTPGSLIYKMSGVDFKEVLAYQKLDPRFKNAQKKALEAGDLSDDLYLPKWPEPIQGARYIGWPHLWRAAPMAMHGDIFVRMMIPYKWGLRLDESGRDNNYADVEMRNRIFSEWKFLKKYVPGFESSHVTGIAPMTASRDGRHPVGEYMLTYADIKFQRKFPDAVLSNRRRDPLEFEAPQQTGYEEPDKSSIIREFDVPYRCFLVRTINNLLTSGDCLSFNHECRVNVMKSIDWSILTGEVAGTAAALSVKQKITPKEFKWTMGKMYEYRGHLTPSVISPGM